MVARTAALGKLLLASMDFSFSICTMKTNWLIGSKSLFVHQLNLYSTMGLKSFFAGFKSK